MVENMVIPNIAFNRTASPPVNLGVRHIQAAASVLCHVYAVALAIAGVRSHRFKAGAWLRLQALRGRKRRQLRTCLGLVSNPSFNPDAPQAARRLI